MRVTVTSDPPGVDFRYCEVYLGGFLLDGCIAADDEVGKVTVYIRDRNGRLTLKDGQALVSTMEGEVEIRLVHANDGSWPHSGYPDPLAKDVDIA